MNSQTINRPVGVDQYSGFPVQRCGSEAVAVRLAGVVRIGANIAVAFQRWTPETMIKLVMMRRLQTEYVYIWNYLH